MNQNPLASFMTWTCSGTFLPGDQRGWIKWHKGDQVPQPLLEEWCRDQMSETLLLLDARQREIVNAVVAQHCEIRGWTLHAVNCRTNHCHVVVTAASYNGELVRDQFKSWAKRRLKENQQQELGPNQRPREQWWTRKGSVRQLMNEESIEAALIYTLEAQDKGGSRANS